MVVQAYGLKKVCITGIINKAPHEIHIRRLELSSTMIYLWDIDISHFLLVVTFQAHIWTKWDYIRHFYILYALKCFTHYLREIKMVYYSKYK